MNNKSTRAIRAVILLAACGTMMAFGMGPTKRVFSQIRCGGLDGDTLAPRGHTGEGSGGGKACPDAQPVPANTTPAIWDDPMIGQTSSSCDLDMGAVDGYQGVVMFPTQPYLDGPPSVGLPIICGLSYNSGATGNCKSEAIAEESEHNEEPLAFVCLTDPGMWQGRSFFDVSRPQLAISDEDDYLFLYYDNRHRLGFKRVPESDAYVGVNGNTWAAERVSIGDGLSPEATFDIYKIHDRGGRVYWFFGKQTGGDGEVLVDSTTYTQQLTGQLWKVTIDNDEGATSPESFVGSSNASSDLANAYTGFEICGSYLTPRVNTMWDMGGRKYTFGYSQVSGASGQYVKTSAAVWNGAAIVSEATLVYEDSGFPEVPEVLRLIQTKTYLSDSDEYVTKYQYFGFGGSSKSIERTVMPEGVRDLAYGNVMNYDDADEVLTYIDGLSSTTLNAHSALMATYSSGKVATITANGMCGCTTGGPSGTYTYSYSDNPDLTDTPGTYEGSGTWWTEDIGGSPVVHPQWKRRMIRVNPDSTYEVTYYDDLAQVLAKVKCKTDPSTVDGTQKYYATVYERDTDGRVSKVYSPECLLTYKHSTGAFTFSETSGLIRKYKYKTTGFDSSDSSAGKYLTGRVVTQTEINEPSGGGVSYRIEAQYDYMTSGTDWYADLPLSGGTDQARLAKPLLIASRVLNNSIASGSSPSSTDYDETTYSYTFWDSSLPWAIKKVTTTMPAVDSGTNGSGSTTSTSNWIDQHSGRVAFSSMPDGRLTFYKYDTGTGQILKRVEDVDAADSDATGAASAFSGAGLSLPSSGTGTKATSTYTYDYASRLLTAITPSVSDVAGRSAFYWHSRLTNHLPLTIAVPKKSGTDYYGPATFTVANLAGKSVESGLLKLNAASVSTAPQGWIGSGDSILETIGSPASVARLNASEYDPTGTRLLKSRVALTWTTGGGGAISSSDDTEYLYDGMGRVVGVKDPTGTIRRTTFDFLGRATTQSIGTDDTSAAIPFITGGSDNMTDVTSTVFNEYDPPSFSYFIARSTVASVTQDPDGNWGTTGDQRTTQYAYDYRNRPLLVTAPVAPHTLTSYDFRGRVIGTATYSSTGSIMLGTTDPTALGTATGRLSATKMEYDSRGRAWQTTQYKITQSTGNRTSDILVSQSWFDDDGRMIKSVSPSGITKYAYDRMDRVVTTYTLAKAVNGSGMAESYTDADDVADDTVLEQSHTTYDPTSGAVLWSMNLSRLHHVTATGAIDSSGQPDPSLSRAQISATWYDDLDRPIASANYGTNHATANGASFTRPGSVPSRSDTVLVSSTVYDKDGTVSTTTDPKGIVTKTLYDNVGRRVATISNFVNGTPDEATYKDDDHYVRYAYTNGLLRYMWVDIAGNDTAGTPPGSLTGSDIDDQITEYVYGTTKGTPGSGVSRIATGHLLQKAIYPPQSSMQSTADRSVLSAYNALGELVWTQDQNGTVLSTTYDNGGRITSRVVTTPGTGIDGTVRRIDLAYTSRSQVETVVQYDATTSGTELNGLKYTYDDWGNISNLEQDRDSAVGGSGAAALSVDWTYVHDAGGTTRPRVSRSSTTLPGSFAITNTFATGTDADIGRVTSMAVTGSGSSRVEYTYMGVGSLVGTNVPEPFMKSNLYDDMTPPVYDALDRFNRVTTSRWSRDASNHFYNVNLIYDQNSNITSIQDTIFDDSAGDKPYSYQYTMDDLNRVIKADRGILTVGGGGAISMSGSLRNTEDWSLSQTGNWLTNRMNLNNDGDVTDTNEYSDTRTFNNVNELLTRSTPSASPTHDKSGQMTNDGSRLKYVYDAFGRVVTIKNQSDDVISEYVYDGLGQRIGWHYDVNASGGGPGDSDPWYWFVYDDRWRIVSTYRISGGTTTSAYLDSFRTGTTDTYAKERFVYHNAGLDGLGGSSYIDSVLMTDRDLSTSWGSAADSTAETRLYYGQNWRADTSVVVSSTGAILRWYKYTAYGKRTEIDAGDFNRDGFVDGFDYDDFIACFEDDICPTGRTADVMFDGQADGFDYDAFMEAYSTSPELEGGKVRNLYAGYESDPTLEATAITDSTGMQLFPDTIYHVRNRVYSTELGRWTRRDPLGYVDGLSLSEYARSAASQAIDPSGMGFIDPSTLPAPSWTSPPGKDVNPFAPVLAPGSTPSSKPAAPKPGTQGWWEVHNRSGVPADNLPNCGVELREAVNGKYVDAGIRHRWIQFDFGDGTPLSGCGSSGKGQGDMFWETPALNTSMPNDGRFAVSVCGAGVDPTGKGTRTTWRPARHTTKYCLDETGGIPRLTSTPSAIKHGSAAGRPCSQADCADIRECIAKYVIKDRGYVLGFNDCHTNAEAALEECCLNPTSTNSVLEKSLSGKTCWYK